MAGMMQRNLRLFEKMNIVWRKEIRKQLVDWKNGQTRDFEKI